MRRHNDNFWLRDPEPEFARMTDAEKEAYRRGDDMFGPPADVERRKQIEQAYIDGSVEGSPIDRDGHRHPQIPTGDYVSNKDVYDRYRRSQEWLRDREDPEDFYDYVAEWREAQKQRRVILWIALGCVLGGVIGISLLLLGAVR